MARVVRAFPLLPGKRADLQSFAAALSARQPETDHFYRSYGVTRESAHLQATPTGDLLIVCTDVADPEPAAKAYAAETAAFDVWFKGQVLALSGIDPNQQPLGPECSCVFDWSTV
jgi:hypothetical protein